jgi:hypothetical protein
MPRTKRPGKVSAGLTVLAIAGITMLTAGFTSTPARPSTSARHGTETIKITGTMPGPRHAVVTAKGAFKAKGYFWRKRASLVFPHGRLAVSRKVTSSTVNPPDLSTCVFTAKQYGTFSVFYATGWYHGLRYSGTYSTTITGHLKKLGDDQCGSKIVAYRTVTYEVGIIP